MGVGRAVEKETIGYFGELFKYRVIFLGNIFDLISDPELMKN